MIGLVLTGASALGQIKRARRCILIRDVRWSNFLSTASNDQLHL